MIDINIKIFGNTAFVAMHSIRIPLTSTFSMCDFVGFKDAFNRVYSELDHLSSLNKLGVPTENWDFYLMFNLALKLDNKTRDEWEAYRIDGEIPTFAEFKVFLINWISKRDTYRVM
ncbi:hypothetical protein NQ315_011224 [Exocentrus adspersus]|uniref:Uncharacterized protein n=1 Tax=Exocentrus adspersus TaxID=1586481 RepID=A0AAV8V4I5_9CUCU|nr:hypothetical protein NQ315_011224 [Exocentrus adspersus]